MKKLKLNQLGKTELEKKEMNKIQGGYEQASCGGSSMCGCGCLYEGQPGGSSSFANLTANWDLGISTND